MVQGFMLIKQLIIVIDNDARFVTQSIIFYFVFEFMGNSHSLFLVHNYCKPYMTDKSYLETKDNIC